MGEIKSTLDLVMARTRHLSMTAEEKRSQQRAECERRLQGLLQQYADGALSAEQVGERFSALQAETETEQPKALRDALVRRIDPDRENARWLDLLAQETPALVEPLQAILEDYREQNTALLTRAEGELLERLAREHGITGAAVAPNVRQDRRFREQLAAIGDEVRVRLKALVDKSAP